MRRPYRSVRRTERSTPGFRWFGNPFEDVLGEVFGFGTHGEIAERDDTNEPSLTIENRQSTDLALVHDIGGLFHFLIGVAVEDVGCHDITDARVAWVVPFRGGTNGDVTVG